jgi:nitric oxide synthase-interacting protein
MSRHAKNCTASAFFTYHEKKKLQYGTQKERIGKDSLHNVDSCRLCIQPVNEPMICQKGHLFCKECIYTSLLTQKQEIKRQTLKYNMQEERLKDEEQKKETKKQERILEEFDKIEHGILPPEKRIKFLHTKEPSSENMTLSLSIVDKTSRENNEKPEPNPANHLPSFWVPSLTPDPQPIVLKKPPSYCICPEENHPIRLKQLIKVNFQTISGMDRKDPNKVLNMRYQCPICSKTFTNVIKISLLRKCGHVFCSQCIDNFVSQDRKCFVCSKSFSESDLIPLQCGGTGFSAHGVSLEATKFNPCAWV